jgi:hypothetical protein
MSTTAPELRSVGEVSSAGYVRRAFLFETVGITAQLWSEQGGDGREAGVRVEMQRLDEQPGASEYDAVELRLHDPIFRADLFRIDTGAPGNFDRAHYHRFEGRYPASGSLTRLWAATPSPGWRPGFRILTRCWRRPGGPSCGMRPTRAG